MQSGHAHESSPVMTGPLVALAIASVAGGFFGIMQFLQPQFSPNGAAVPIFAPLAPFKEAPVAAGLGLAAFAIGLCAAAVLYGEAETDPLPGKFAEVCYLVRHKFYFDELYAELIALTQDAVAQFAEGVDFMLKLVVRMIAGSTETGGTGIATGPNRQFANVHVFLRGGNRDGPLFHVVALIHVTFDFNFYSAAGRRADDFGHSAQLPVCNPLRGAAGDVCFDAVRGAYVLHLRRAGGGAGLSI